MKITQQGNDVIVNIKNFSLTDTLDCGQCFRWEQTSPNTMTGVVKDKIKTIKQTDDVVLFENTTLDEFEDIWKSYFDLDTDYDKIKTIICEDEIIKKSCEYAGGIRILRQDSWEALCSFIISQNNNIPRIKGSINKLCQKFGKQLTEDTFAFPSEETIANCTKEDLASLSLGYRDDYIIDCAQKIVNQEIDLKEVSTLEIEQAREKLRIIKGVGPKVAECALLFGFYRVEAFPIDTWIKKALNYYYTEGFPEFAKQYGGIAQQYIFHYIRTCKDAIPAEYRKK